MNKSSLKGGISLLFHYSSIKKLVIIQSDLNNNEFKKIIIERVSQETKMYLFLVLDYLDQSV